jgi:hypothetical protein
VSALKKYERTLAKRYNLPDPRCIYNPSIYWALTKEEKETIHHLRRNVY